METAEIQFRTAALGGFVKQDVLDYIERANREHGAKLEQLQRELDQCREERDKYRDRTESAERRSVELSAQVQGLRGELSERAAELVECRSESARQEQDAAALREQMGQMKARLEKAEQSARAYESIKDRTAGIELEAHCRAQSIEAAAQEEV